MIKINYKLVFAIIIGLLFLAGGSVLFVDRFLAIFIHQTGLDRLLFLRNLTEGIPVLLLGLTIGALFLFYHSRNGKITRITAPLYYYLTLRLTLEIKTGLKIIFGRYWPKTWINNNLSLIHDGVYGFNWLHGFGNQGSFPSGHSTYVAFSVFWLFVYYPKLRYLWLLLGLGCVLSLITLDYHFLGDCLAGISFGTLSALCAITFWHKITVKNSSVD